MNEPSTELSFEDLYTAHAPRLFSYLARRTDRHVAEDLTAQVFVVAMSAAGTYDPARGEHGAWLWGIATNLLREHHRRETRAGHAMARVRAEGAPIDDDMSSAADRVAAGFEWPRVRDALATLDELDREALLLFAWAELPYDAIAAAMGSPLGTVKSRISRARRVLRAQLGLPERKEDAP